MEEAGAVLLREGTGAEMGTDRKEVRPLWGVEGRVGQEKAGFGFVIMSVNSWQHSQSQCFAELVKKS